jgi:hypothetical protein
LCFKSKQILSIEFRSFEGSKMLTSSNPTEQQDSLDSSCRGLEAPDKAASKKDAAVKVVADDMKAKMIEDSGVLVTPEPTKEGAANINNKKVLLFDNLKGFSTKLKILNS